MNSYKCRIERLKTLQVNAVLMTSSLLQKLGCTPNSSIRLSCGNKEAITRIISNPKKKGDTIYIPQTLASALALPHTNYTRVTYDNKVLRLGPVIGIATTGYTGITQRPFGGRTSLFKQFIIAGKEEGPIMFVFTPSMVDWEHETITGWFYEYDDRLRKFIWKADRAPLPDVVYDRVPNRKKEAEPSVIQLKERMLNHRHPVRWFNQGFFNKWDIYAQLYNHPLASTYIPETIRSPDTYQLEQLLNRHRMIYLKPNNGSLGLGIIRITYIPESGYYCRYHTMHGNILRRFTSIKNVVKHFFAKHKYGMRSYIAQQGIHLMRDDNRPVDFRIHMHKDEHNQWKVVGMAAKVAGSGSVTTHVRTGGHVIPATVLFQKLYGTKSKPLQQKLIQASIDIAEALEQSAPGLLGELGLDIGLDIYHRVWLFEVNAKPGRHIFYHPQLRIAGRESARYITRFGLKLANFV